MRFIRFHTRDRNVPIYVARDAIDMVCEATIHEHHDRGTLLRHLFKKRSHGIGKADVLVGGEWMRLEQSPADVMRMLGEGIAA